jgi:mono/diheme cytochrome c family protein
MRTAVTSLFAFALAVCSARSQEGPTEEVRKGHQLAIILCANCHLAAPDQPSRPVLNPAAPSFQSLAQRRDLTSDALAKFITTTHRGLDHPNGMPNPSLADYQVKQVVAYLLSLRE